MTSLNTTTRLKVSITSTILTHITLQASLALWVELTNVSYMRSNMKVNMHIFRLCSFLQDISYLVGTDTFGKTHGGSSLYYYSNWVWHGYTREGVPARSWSAFQIGLLEILSVLWDWRVADTELIYLLVISIFTIIYGPEYLP